jgi:hypothetical protein
MYDNDVYLSNSEPTDLIFLQSCRLILIWLWCPGVSHGRIGSKLWIMLKSNEPPRPESAHSLRQPILPAVLPWPTKGKPRESIGPKPFARPSCLLVDPGDVRPPQAPNLWVDFEIISPKILGPAYGRQFSFWWWSLRRCTCWTLLLNSECLGKKQSSVVFLWYI